MDDPMPTTPVGDTIIDEDDDFAEFDLPPKDDNIVLAQLVANPPVSTSNPSIELLDMENLPAPDEVDESKSDAFAT